MVVGIRGPEAALVDGAGVAFGDDAVPGLGEVLSEEPMVFGLLAY